MRRRETLGLALCSLWPALGQAALPLGQVVPDLQGTDVQGRRVRLADFRGRYMVLEWTNPGCPFVQKHYRSGNLQALQAEARRLGVVWLTVNSTADGSADFLTPAQMERWLAEQKAMPAHALMDEDGLLGRALGARTALHFFILDPRASCSMPAASTASPATRSRTSRARPTTYARG